MKLFRAVVRFRGNDEYFGEHMSSFNSATIRKYLIELKDLIVAHLKQVDGKKFIRNN